MISDILKRTAPLQELLQSLPFFDLIRRRLIQREQYVACLRAFAIITQNLETELARLTAIGAISQWNEEMCRGPDLLKDVQVFQALLVPDLPSAVEEAQKIASAVRLAALERPFVLIGYLKVLELVTARIAGKAKIIRELLGLSDGVTWLQGDPASAIHDLPPEAEPDVETGVREAMEGMSRVLASIYPERDDSRRILVTTLNPEAGRHPIPKDPRELEAALVAGEACWNEYPYYQARYGERGRRFTGSDSAWVATLIALPQQDMDRQIDWLANFLALRGMPRVTMETFLLFLVRELLIRVPEKEAAIRKLQTSAERLRETRLSVFSQEASAEVVTAFTSALAHVWPDAIPNLGILLVSAMADEVTGAPGAEKTLVDWLTEVGRFPVSVGDLVRGTVASARGRMAKAGR